MFATNVETQLPPVSASARHETIVDVVRARASEPQAGNRGLLFLGEDGAEVESATFAELDEAARKIAVRLRRLSADGDRVLLLFPSGLEFVKAFLGCLYAGRIAVPLFPPDLGNLTKSLPRFRKLVADAQPSLAMAPAESVTLLRAGSLLFPELRKVKWLALDHCAGERAAEWDRQGVSAETIAFLQYTSGSTSDPKGVIVSHRNLVVNSEIICGLAENGPESVCVSWLPMYHDMGLIGGVLQPIYMGGRGVLMSPFTFLRRPLRWLEAISRYKATTSPFPNFALHLCIKRIGEEDKARLDLRSWRVACNGAEPVREDTLRRFSEAFARCGFDPRAHFPVYGLAESTLLACGGRAGEGARVRWLSRQGLHDDRVVECRPGDGAALPVVSCGRATEGHTIEIVDPRTNRRCEAERVGEIWLAGASVAHGYWRNPRATGEHFGARLDDEPEQTFLRTGDLGFLKEGELYVTGRLKDVIIIGGANLYPHDIEMAAERSPDADIRAGCSAAFSLSVEHQERLVIVAESKQTGKPQLDDSIKAVRRGIIDGIGIVPYRVVLIEPGTISKTSSGKIQRRLTRTRYLDGKLSCLREG